MSTLRDPAHVLIRLSLGLCVIKASPMICASVFDQFYELLFLTSIMCSLVPHVVKFESSYFLFEWRHRHLVSIHLLIAAGYGDQLGPVWYLAFIMPLCPLKRGLRKTPSAFSTPPPQITA